MATSVLEPPSQTATPPQIQPLGLPTALYAIRWLILDTFRQARAARIFHLMLGVSAMCILVCLSVGVEGSVPLSNGGRPVEFLPKTDLHADPQKAAAAGVEILRGELTLAFGAIRLPLSRDAADAVRFVQAVLALGIAHGVGLLLVLIWTAGFLPTFLDPGAASVMLTKPIPRWSLLLGKFVGVLVFVAFQACVFVGGTWLALALKTGVWDANYLLAIPLLLLQFSIFFSFSALLAVTTRSTVACVLGSLLFWGICLGLNYGRHAALAFGTTDVGTGAFSWSLELAYWVLPKPGDLGMILLEGMKANHFFGPGIEYEKVRALGQFSPEWAVLTSLLSALVFLGLSAYEFVTADY